MKRLTQEYKAILALWRRILPGLVAMAALSVLGLALYAQQMLSAWAAVSFIGLGLLGGLAVTWLSLRPLQRLLLHTQTLLNQAPLSSPAAPGGDVIAHMRESLDGFLQTWQQQQEELQAYHQMRHDFEALLHKRLLERTHSLEEKNTRLRMITEELGRSFAQMDDEMKLLGKMQKSLLPGDAIDRHGLSLRALYLPNGRAGGDYYDFLVNSANEVFLVIADVSGHGSPAAFVMGITRAILHNEIKFERSPALIMRELNSVLMTNFEAKEFMTMFLARYSPYSGELVYSNAGHPPPLLQQTDGSLTEIDGGRGLPLGVIECSINPEESLMLQQGNRLVFYTDGLTETHINKTDAYGLERLKQILGQQKHSPNEAVLEQIVLDIQDYLGRPLEIEPLEDDLTVMVIDVQAKPIQDNQEQTPRPEPDGASSKTYTSS